jgi:hypothetical protein
VNKFDIKTDDYSLESEVPEFIPTVYDYIVGCDDIE